mgnify:CR=1 FL=1
MGFEGKNHRKDIKKQLFLVQLLDFQGQRIFPVGEGGVGI